MAAFLRALVLVGAGDDLRISQTCLSQVSLHPVLYYNLFGTTYTTSPTSPFLNLRHAGTGSTSRRSTGPRTEASTTRLAEHDERKDHGAGESSPSKPEECNRCLRLAAALLTVERAVGDTVTLGVLLVEKSAMQYKFLVLPNRRRTSLLQSRHLSLAARAIPQVRKKRALRVSSRIMMAGWPDQSTLKEAGVRYRSVKTPNAATKMV